MKCLFEGTGVAIVTPFSAGKIDFDAFEKLIERAIAGGVKAIIVLGTTGEGATVKLKEREKIIKFSARVIAGRVKLIVGTGHNDFSTAYRNTLEAKRLGADGALIVTPYYNKTTQEGLIEYYARLSEIGLPIIMYNVPSRTGLSISLETIKTLLDLEMIYGIKESSSDILRIIELSKICRDKISVYSGEDGLNYLFYFLGGKGCISVSANILPQKVQMVYDYVCDGEFKNAIELQDELKPLNDALFIETNPIPVKYLLYKLGYIENELRLPLVGLSEKNYTILDTIAADIIKNC